MLENLHKEMVHAFDQEKRRKDKLLDQCKLSLQILIISLVDEFHDQLKQ